MNRQLLRNIPFYLPLIPLFYVWHISNAYFRLVDFYYPLVYFLVTGGATVLLFLGAKWILKNNNAAALWAASVAIPFLFWAPFHDFIRDLPLPKWIASYTFLLPCFACFIIGILIGLKRKKRGLYRITFFLNALFFLFISIEAGNSIYKYATGQIGTNDTHLRLARPIATPALAISDTAAIPDIFFIVFDEYASTRSLNKYLGFDNSRLDSVLLQNHFYIASQSKSNYNSTPHSITSTLNTDYLPLELEGSPSDAKHMLEAQYLYRQSKLPHYLKQLNYRIVNLGLMDLEDFPVAGPSYFDRDMDAIFFREMLWGRIYHEIWWNFTTRWPALKLNRSSREKKHTAAVLRNERNFELLQKELAEQTHQSKLVIAHIMSPHAPFYYDSTGKERNIGGDLHLPDDSLYLDQLQYINTWINKLAVLSNKPFPRPRIVIIEGDHGKRDNRIPIEQRERDKQFMNLNAYYFSDGHYDSLYPAVSPVNSFRIVLNKYFNAGLSILPDSSIMIR